MSDPTGWTSRDRQEIDALAARVRALEKAGGTEPAKSLTDAQQAQLAAMAAYLSEEQLAEVRAKMLAAN